MFANDVRKPIARAEPGGAFPVSQRSATRLAVRVNDTNPRQERNISRNYIAVTSPITFLAEQGEGVFCIPVLLTNRMHRYNQQSLRFPRIK